MYHKRLSANQFDYACIECVIAGSVSLLLYQVIASLS